jgi:CubicO group peptidase (beta-lactamase class C family)
METTRQSMVLADGTPQSAGFDEAKLDSAFQRVEEWVRSGAVSGAVVLVARLGRIAKAEAYGHIAPDPDSAKATVDTVFPAASITKVATATALLKQVDAGRITLDTPVCEILTEWTPPGVEVITLRHLLSHTSGLPEDLEGSTLDYEDRNSIDVIVDAFMQLPPKKAPGQELIYSNAGIAIAGRLLERLAGVRVGQAVKEAIIDPLWLDSTWFGEPPVGREANIATIGGTDRPGTDLDPYNGAYFRSLGHAWGGMFSSVTDLASLAQIFLDNGRPLLTINMGLAGIRNQTNGLRGGFANWPRFPTGDWGLGWEIKGGRGRHWSGGRTSHATFGHIGQSGCMMWADPMKDLICVALANQVLSTGWSVSRPHCRWETFSDAVVDAAVD